MVKKYLLVTFCLVFTGCEKQGQSLKTLAGPGVSSDHSVKDARLKPYTHLDVLAILRSDDSAMTKQLDVAPVHTVFNKESIIPPMCYTRTEGKFNPCYVCHQDEKAGRENKMNDGELQSAYSFSDVGLTNQWENLFEDRRDKVDAISDEEIQAWVAEDNYSRLAERLRAENFEGWIPDLENLQLAAEAFDSEGFAKDGSHWVAFNYKPFPSTFWPTNGSTDDVMIRLPEPFRTTVAGDYSRDIYKTNLAIVESKIKGLSEISVNSVDEIKVGVDLDGNNTLEVVNRITNVSDYVGAAKGYFSPANMYPLNTEFLHSVRYVGVDSNGDIYVPPRMKELRYMSKKFILTQSAMDEAYRQEHYDKEQGNLPGYIDRGHHGLDNEMGWLITGFLENKKGELRYNTFEENMFCMGCHTSIGSTIDKTFSFPRKVDGAEGWGYIDLRGMPDAPNKGEEKGEIATYFERVGGGGEFRSNPEMQERWFTKSGEPDYAKINQAADVYELIMPSPERAMALNKAYKAIVHEQDFIFGRDATIEAPSNVYNEIDNETSPTLPPRFNYSWNIQLDWGNAYSE